MTPPSALAVFVNDAEYDSTGTTHDWDHVKLDDVADGTKITWPFCSPHSPQWSVSTYYRPGIAVQRRTLSISNVIRDVAKVDDNRLVVSLSSSQSTERELRLSNRNVSEEDWRTLPATWQSSVASVKLMPRSPMDNACVHG